jgi:hypothetical protein
MGGASVNNPPAFPTGTDGNSKGLSIEESQGMTLRDYVAIAMLPTLSALDDTVDGAVKEAYRYADAVLKEREK